MIRENLVMTPADPLGDLSLIPPGRLPGHVRYCIDTAAKANACGQALRALDKARSLNVDIATHTRMVLLHLCSGGETWEEQLARVARGADLDLETVNVARGHALLSELGTGNTSTSTSTPASAISLLTLTSETPLPEMAWTAQARFLALSRNYEGALTCAQHATDPSRGGHRDGPRLRTYAPAILGFAFAGDVEGTLKAYDTAKAAGVLLTEHEFRAILTCLARAVGPRMVTRSVPPEFVAVGDHDHDHDHDGNDGGNDDHVVGVAAPTSTIKMIKTEAKTSKDCETGTNEVVDVAVQGVLRILGDMTEEIIELTEETIVVLEQFFTSAGAQRLFVPTIDATTTGTTTTSDAHATTTTTATINHDPVPPTRLVGRGEAWAVTRCRADASGSTPAGDLLPVVLTPGDWEQFLAGVAKLAGQRENRADSFQKFVVWLKRHGPYSAIIDGANLALYGQNYAEGCFRFSHIDACLDLLRDEHPELKPLVFLHVGRTRAREAQEPEAQAVLERLKREKALFVTPAGSNDDWYWLYAVLAAAEKGMLISNDQMRDHIFSLLAPKYFKKWRQRHQVTYKVGADPEAPTITLYPPLPYSRAMQRLTNGGWAFPIVGGDTWMVAFPRGAGATRSVRPSHESLPRRGEEGA